MKLRQITIDKKFIPDWNGNLQLAPNEQTTIHFVRIPGTSEKSTYQGIRFNNTGGMELIYNDNLLCSTFILKVENLEIGDTVIKTGADLATASHPALETLFPLIRKYLFPEDEELTAGE